jgi:hypothetical protein
MSQTTTNSLTKALAWCDTARDLVGKARPKAKDYFDAAQQLGAIFADSNGRPAEISFEEWDAATTDVADARSGKVAIKSPALIAVAQRPQTTNFEKYHGEVDGIVGKLKSSVEQRRKAFAQLDGTALAPFTPDGIAPLRCSDNPQGMLNRAADLKNRMAATATHPNPRVKFFVDEKAAKEHNDNFNDEYASMDLDAAETSVQSMEKLREAAIKEQAEVSKLRIKYATDPAKPADNDLAGWRKLNARDNAAKAIADRFPAVLLAAEKVGETNTGKRQQCENFGPRVRKALAAWDDYPIAIKLSNHDKTEGTIPWLQDKLDRLEAAPYASASEEEAKILEVQWKKFADDVWAGWKAFENSRFRNKNLRGPMGDPALRPWRVEQVLTIDSKHKIGGKTFTVSSSETTGTSLKASFPKPPGGYMLNKNGDEMAHYIYHLVPAAT